MERTRFLPIICLLSLCFPANLKGDFDIGKRNVVDNQAKGLVNAPTENEKEASGDLQVIIPFIKKTGDCSLIKYGNTEILIDAGGTSESGQYVVQTLEQYVTDGILDMMIITHGDKDHTDSIYSDVGVNSWLSTEGRKITNVVHFDSSHSITGLSTTPDTYFNAKTSATKDSYTKFSSLAREYPSFEDLKEFFTNNYIKNSKIDNVFSALQCTADRDGAKSTYYLSNDGGFSDSPTACSFSILYNHYYDNTGYTEINNRGESSWFDLYDNSFASALKNSQSVCSLLDYDGERYLFTGDLEEYNTQKSDARIYGETYLVDDNPILKEGVTFYKAGHHCSRTSSSKRFLNTLRPQYVAIEAIANDRGNSFGGYYSFPHQSPLNNITEWTDKIYITGQYDDNLGDLEYHGTIVFNQNARGIQVSTTGRETSNSIFDSEWFSTHRTAITTIRFFASETSAGGYCTLIKRGLTEYLINSGIKTDKQINKSIYMDKISKYCNDGVLECVSVSGGNREFYNDMYTKDGLFASLASSRIKKIQSFILPLKYSLGVLDSEGITKHDESLNNLFETITNLKDSGLIDNVFGYAGKENEASYGPFNSEVDLNGIHINILNNRFDDPEYAGLSHLPHLNDISVMVTVDGISFLNIGGTDDDGSSFTNADGSLSSAPTHRAYQTILSDNPGLKNEIALFDVPNHGMLDEEGKRDLLFHFMKTINASSGYAGYTYQVLNGTPTSESNYGTIHSNNSSWKKYYYQNPGFTGCDLSKLVITELYSRDDNIQVNGDSVARIESLTASNAGKGRLKVSSEAIERNGWKSYNLSQETPKTDCFVGPKEYLG